ncbi:MAG: transcriptional regulator [Paenibacillaceae bacterium]|jgi:DNA-binding MarR family transcriptional regulator|nr:transcriptional regulator [Paenibacillaceae bacterium]
MQEQPPHKGLFPWDSEEQIGSLVKMVSIAMRRQIEKVLRPLGVTPQQGQALRILLCHPGSTHTDLERILNIEKPSVTSLVNGLEKRGWVIRRLHQDDGRIKQIYLTDHGAAMAEQTVIIVEQLKGGLDQALSSEETEALKQLLKKVRNYWDNVV